MGPWPIGVELAAVLCLARCLCLIMLSLMAPRVCTLVLSSFFVFMFLSRNIYLLLVTLCQYNTCAIGQELTYVFCNWMYYKLSSTRNTLALC